jgi:hypothetical protein
MPMTSLNIEKEEITENMKFSHAYHIISHIQPTPFIQHLSCTWLAQKPIQATPAVQTKIFSWFNFNSDKIYIQISEADNGFTL